MNAVLTCLAYQHNPFMVLLAGILCLLANVATMVMVGRARAGTGHARLAWVGFAAAAGGFGIWATHFGAMLAYDPGFRLGFTLSPTLISLALAFITTGAAGLLAIQMPGLQGAIAAGAVFGAGVSCMHFTGMTAIEFGGTISWSRPLVIAAVIAAVVISPIAFAIVDSRRKGRVAAAAAILSLAIVSMHFIAMGAMTLVPIDGPEPGWTLSKPLMLATIVAVSLSLIGSGLAVAAAAGRAQKSTKLSEANFQLFVRGVTDYAIYMLDPAGVVTNWNAGAQRAKGYTAEEIVGEHFGRFYSAEERMNGMPQTALETAREAGRFEAEGRRFRKDGSWFWAHVVIHPILDDEDKLVGYAKITRDITRQKADADRITAISHNLDVALENMTQGICLFNENEELILANGRYSQIYRFPAGFVRPGMSYWQIVLKGYQTAFGDVAEARERAKIHYDRAKEAIFSGEHSVTMRTADDRTVLMIFSPLPSGGWVATFEDISQRIASEKKIAFMARHDALTELPNRAALIEHLSAEIENARQVAVIGIDLNKFKQINDQLGHAVGDRVLKEIAGRMTAMLRQGEMMARFGGDEFVAVKRYGDLSEVHDFIDKLQRALTMPIQFEGHSLSSGGSMGIALYPHDGRSPEALIANADLAMYRAKGSLTRHVCFYDVAMDEVSRDRAKMAKDLWSAIEEGQLRLHYQVQKSVSSGEITGYEVLLRWRHPERGNVSPADFITVAEECGAILPIGEWVLREACREAAAWPNRHKIAVNLSPVQIAHVDMPALVHTVLLETGLQPGRLELEITESSIIGDKQRALNAMRSIKALGVSIAIDDFGTGYSSLETLRSFPFDKIKLDRSFLTEVEVSDQAKAMVRAILALGEGLRIPVLAEGVETVDQLDILRHEGCQEAQGYLLGRPMPMDEQAEPVVAAA